MASTTENTAQHAHAPIHSGFDAIGDRVANFLVWLGDMSSGAKAANHAARLAGLSDAQLAEMGLKRENIVEHAFGHLIRG